jgi:hypothetical protein
MIPKSATALILCSILAACSTTPQIETVTVEKPVPVACVKEIPDPPTPPVIAADADIEQKAAWAVLRIRQLQQYANELRAILLACKETP